MTRHGPKRRNVAVRLSQEQIDALDELAAVGWCGRETRSDIIRLAIDYYLKGDTP